MARIISILTIVLMVFLFPPAVLALISNNAIPGELTYPIKRILETAILQAASINPTTKAWFTIKRSSRRFDEVTLLIASGNRSQTVSHSLTELVAQTDQAARDIVKIQDKDKRDELIDNLRKQIKKYRQELIEAKKKIESEPEYQTSSPASTHPPDAILAPTSQPIYPTPPIRTRAPLPTAVPTSAPTPVPASGAGNLPVAIGNTNDDLGNIDNRLNQEQQNNVTNREDTIVRPAGGGVPAQDTPAAACIAMGGTYVPEEGCQMFSPVTSSPKPTVEPVITPEPVTTPSPDPNRFCYKVLSAPGLGCDGPGTVCNDNGVVTCTPHPSPNP